MPEDHAEATTIRPVKRWVTTKTVLRAMSSGARLAPIPEDRADTATISPVKSWITTKAGIAALLRAV